MNAREIASAASQQQYRRQFDSVKREWFAVRWATERMFPSDKLGVNHANRHAILRYMTGAKSPPCDAKTWAEIVRGLPAIPPSRELQAIKKLNPTRDEKDLHALFDIQETLS